MHEMHLEKTDRKYNLNINKKQFVYKRCKKSKGTAN